ncbi:hypothetical protein FHG87_016303 [Trinorchestia longiramus]|nr:hypothetical protein FHG87_016303 [Trinorchestia longiramus]
MYKLVIGTSTATPELEGETMREQRQLRVEPCRIRVVAVVVDARRGAGNVDCDFWIVDSGATQHMCNKQSEFSSYSDLSSPVRVEIGDGRALKGNGVGDVRLKITLPNMQCQKAWLNRDVVFNESQFVICEEAFKRIECVPFSFSQEEKHEDSEGELELRRSTMNRAAPDRFGGWVVFCTKEIDLVCCPSNDMLADIFTKGVSAEKFSRLRRKLGVVFFEKHIQCEKEC